METAPTTETLDARADVPRQARFQLVRHFSLTSLLGVLLVLAVLVYFYRAFALDALEQHETRDNVAITRIFAGTIWPRYATFLAHTQSLSRTELQSHPEIARIRADVTRQMQGLSVVKVKIYDLDGRTVFSTDVRQIGDDKSQDTAFRSAKAGQPMSEIVFRNQFDAFENVINERNLISSYIPIRSDDSKPPEGVFEVYSDVTEYVGELERATLRIVALVLVSLGLLYGFLYLIVRRAQHTIDGQRQEVEQAHLAILTHQARHDALTSLPNRLGLSERLDAILRQSSASHTKFALLHVGLDGFKAINDSLGHPVGDQVLTEAGRRLSDLFRRADVVARLGGDEFMVVISEVAQALEIERIVQAVQRVQTALSAAPVRAADHSLRITACVGVAIFPHDGATSLELLKSADIALSHAKRAGPDSYQFHTADMNQRALNLLTLERELREALLENQLVLHYQPKIDIVSGQVVGAEALIRWQHPSRGLLSPAHFIAFAEERHLIVSIGEWVLREACRQSRIWLQGGQPMLPIAINLSAQHFAQKTLFQQVQHQLQAHDLPHRCLELELTETSLTLDPESAVANMQRLRAEDVALALDDFGTGYSSLSQLKGLPLTTLKVDQSFVRGLPDDHDNAAICSAVIAMGHALGLNIIAEGVETAEQLQVLRQLGCDQAQGYFFARPMPVEQFERFVQQTGSAPMSVS